MWCECGAFPKEVVEGGSWCVAVSEIRLRAILSNGMSAVALPPRYNAAMATPRRPYSRARNAPLSIYTEPMVGNSYDKEGTQSSVLLMSGNAGYLLTGNSQLHLLTRATTSTTHLVPQCRPTAPTYSTASQTIPWRHSASCDSTLYSSAT